MDRYRFNVQGVNAAINYTTPEIGAERTLKALYAHSVVASGTSENLVLTLISHLGSDYDTVLISQDMDTVTDYAVLDGSLNAPLHPADKLKVTYTNTDSETISVLLVLE
ncbi:MAG: hypothetical protein GY841_10390 [FCB group bacterium]|nr:hypothetical protein [FCB group bacterium]